MNTPALAYRRLAERLDRVLTVLERCQRDCGEAPETKEIEPIRQEVGRLFEKVNRKVLETAK